jgi:hypothetical protein
MGILDLAQYEPLSPSEPEPPAQKRSPAAAFLLGAVFPGLGHLYLGQKRNAAWTAGFYIVFSAMLIAGIAGGLPTFLGTAILGLPAFYIFGFFDAYLSAREWNAGLTSYMIGSNPRVACLLNFLTKGFGYFYLGERGKGATLFVVLTAAQIGSTAVFKSGLWLVTVLLGTQILLAADGYREAVRQLVKQYPWFDEDPTGEANRESMPVVVPLIHAGVTVRGSLGMLALFVLLGSTHLPAVRTATLDQGSSGWVYTDKTDGLTLAMPSSWKVSAQQKGIMALGAVNSQHVCSAGLRIERTWLPESMYLQTIRALYQKRTHLVSSSESPMRLGDSTASTLMVEIRPLRGTGQATYLYLSVKRGLTMFTLVEANPQNCSGEMASIEHSFQLSR